MPSKREWLARRRMIPGLLLLGIAAFATWLMLPAHQQGVIAAWVDRVRGHDEVKTFGLPSPYADDYARLLQVRYGVEVRPVAGCGVTQDLIEYVRAYNSAVKSRVETRFGKDVFSECRKDAQDAWNSAN